MKKNEQKKQEGKKFSLGKLLRGLAGVFVAFLVVVFGIYGLYKILAPNMEGSFVVPTYTSADYLMESVRADANLDSDSSLYVVFDEEGDWQYGYSEYYFEVGGTLDAFGLVVPYHEIQESFGSQLVYHENYGQHCYFNNNVFLDVDNSLFFGVIETTTEDPSFEEWCQQQYIRDPVTVWVVTVGETSDGLQVSYSTEEWDIRIAFDFLY